MIGQELTNAGLDVLRKHDTPTVCNVIELFNVRPRLRGHFTIWFTGMRLLDVDGSELHGIGVVPDVEAAPDPAEFAAGEDPELKAAVKVLTQGQQTAR